jgi:ribose transport system substrate-binding protein
MRLSRIVFASVAAGAALGACARKEGPAEREKQTIAVIPKGTTHEFWRSVEAGAKKAASELGVEVIWRGPIKENDRAQQISIVEDFVVRGVDGIVLAPLDDTALRSPVANAVGKGVPVVIIDSGLRSEDHVSFVATDNRAGGRLAGEHLAGLLGGRGRVILLRYQEGSASTTNREDGFLEAVAKRPDIEVVSSNQYGGPQAEDAYKASENLLGRLKTDEGLAIDGIFCPNESTTFGMLRALQEERLAGTVRFVGFDASEKLVEALEAGEIDALTVQNPLRMGYLGVKTMVDHLNGVKVDGRIDTGVALVTRENMDRPEYRDVIAPDLDKWLR